MDTETKAQHTPGPWWEDESHPGRILARTETSPTFNRVIAEVSRFGPDADANTYLIAAAPMLLDAARLALRVAEDWIHDELDGTKLLAGNLEMLQPVRDAIAKATGEQS